MENEPIWKKWPTALEIPKGSVYSVKARPVAIDSISEAIRYLNILGSKARRLRKSSPMAPRIAAQIM